MELLTGSDASAQLAGKETVDEVDKVFDAFMAGGQVPGYVTDSASWPTVTVTGGGHTLSYPVCPLYWGVGTNADPLFAGKTSEFFAQKVADNYDAILPTEKMVDDIQAQSDPKIMYVYQQKSDGTEDASTAGVIAASAKLLSMLTIAGVTPGDGKLAMGGKKAYVVRPNLNGDYIAIYGGRKNMSGTVIQPTSGHAHTTGQQAGTWNYSGPSHGIILVGRQGTLDGNNVDMRDVVNSKDPAIAAIVSKEGAFDPVFPNAGAGAVSKMAFGLAQDLGSVLGSDDLSTAAGRTAATRKGAGTILGAVAGAGVWFAMRASPLVGALVTVAGAAVGRIVGGALSSSNPGTGDAPVEDVPAS